MCRRILVALFLSACTVPDSEPPARLSLWRDDGGSLRAEAVGAEPDAGGSGTARRDAGVDRLLRSAPNRTRDVGVCSADHWCWENPLPQGNALFGVWADPGGGEVWAVGAGGVALRFDGKAWTRVPTGVSVPLTAIWGAAREHLFALGPGTLLVFDGKSFKKEQPPEGEPSLLWGSGPTDVWAAGTGIAHFDGEKWAVSLPGSALRVVGLTGTGPQDLWALARDEGKNKGQAILLRFDGKVWAKSALPFALQTGAILPLSPTEAWLATDQGVVARFDGKGWKKALDAGGPGSRPLFVPLPKGAVALVGPKGALFLLEKGAFVKKDKGAPALRAACAAGEARWAVGERGVIARWSGDGFERVAGVGEDDLFAVHGSSRDDVWAVGAQGAVLHRSDMEWKRVDSGLKGALRGVFAASPEDVWVAGDGELAHWDGRAFASRYEASMGPLKGVCGRTGAEVYVVGDGGVWRYDGKAWQHVDTPATYPLDAVTANADGSVWALGEGGMVRLETGTNWVEVGASKVNAPTVLFAGPAGPYVAGAQGVWRHDGKSWASVLSKLETVGGFASATDDVWALSKGDEARQWNGVGWRRSVTGALSPLRAVWSRNGEAFAVGDGGAVLHFRP